VVVENQRTNKAVVTQEPEKALPKMLSLLSCLQFVAAVILDAANSLAPAFHSERNIFVFSTSRRALLDCLGNDCHVHSFCGQHLGAPGGDSEISALVDDETEANRGFQRGTSRVQRD
jgi:hypothetical protein